MPAVITDFLRAVVRCIVMCLADIVFHVLYRTHIIGYENIPETGGALIASNHISALETILVPYASVSRFSMRRYRAPAKEELFRFPPLAWLLLALGAFPVRRHKHDYAAMNKTTEYVKKDLVMLFPEGTRSRTGKLLPGRPGVGKIIHDSKATVIPTVVFNTNYCMGFGQKFPNLFLDLYVVFGKPLDLARFYELPPSKETSMLIVNEVMKAIARLQKEYAHLDKPPKSRIKSENEERPVENSRG